MGNSDIGPFSKKGGEETIYNKIDDGKILTGS
jgi:hypothetical protein